MKIKQLKLKNFAGFTDFECVFDNEITHLVGVNGSGKSFVGITAIWACVKGVAERSKDGLIGERFRFIKGKSADLQLTVYDEKTGETIEIKNHMTAQGNSITCEPVQNETWLSDFFNVAFLSAKNFCNMDSKKQALLLGIDVEKFDIDLKILKEQYTLINRDIREFGSLDDIEEVKSVNINELIRKKDDLESEYYEKQSKISEHNQNAHTRNEQRTHYFAKISDLKKQLAKCEKWLEDYPNIKIQNDIAKPNIDFIKEQIANAQDLNKKANEYQINIQRKKDKLKKEDELFENKERQSKVEANRLSYIQSFNFGFDGLKVDFDGNLLLNDRPIKEPYFSKGELEIIIAKLHISINPNLHVRFIDDFELLDEDNQKKIVDGLLASGFQIITAEVGKKKTKKNTILLRECKQVDNYNEKEKIL